MYVYVYIVCLYILCVYVYIVYVCMYILCVYVYIVYVCMCVYVHTYIYLYDTNFAMHSQLQSFLHCHLHTALFHLTN